MNIKSNRYSIVLAVITGILAILYVFTISHIDCNTITTWAYDLLESVRRGELREFPVYTYETHDMATNYTLFSNVINAIWLLPLYLIDTIGGFDFSLIIYDVYFKVLGLVVMIISYIMMGKILDKMNLDVLKKSIGLYALGTSSILLMTVLGKGQIDIFDLLMVILAIYSYMNGKIELSFLFIGIGCLFKPFILLLGVPYFLLMLGRSKGKSVINGIFMVAPYLIDTGFTRLLMPRYSQMSRITSERFAEEFGISRMAQIFELHLNSVLIFVAAALIICFICLHIGLKGTATNKDLLFYPLLMFLSFGIFVDFVAASATYWYAIIIPIMVIMGLQFEKIEDFLILNLGINAGIIMFIPLAEKVVTPAMNFSVLHNLRKYDSPLSVLYGHDSVKYMKMMSATLFIICILLICGIFFYEKMLSKNNDNKEAGTDSTAKSQVNVFTKVLLALTVAPQIFYLLFVYIVC